MKSNKLHFLFLIVVLGCSSSPSYDVIIRNGQIMDGSGKPSFVGDIGIVADTIAAMGDLANLNSTLEIDAKGLVVAPGFINMLSWANVDLIEDGRSLGDIKQGVTLEVMGEGSSMGPLTDDMKVSKKENQSDIQYDIAWTSLGEYLQYLEDKGISTNVASFIGNGTVREYVIGYENRPATPEELERMSALVEEAMKEGAVGISSSLLYAPSGYADTEELIALAKVASKYNGRYISHIRDEGDRLFEAIEELIRIGKEANIGAEIYHLKASGEQNWDKMDSVFKIIDHARGEGLDITADMYTYPASSTGLHVQLPDWVREGGVRATLDRLNDTSLREKILKDINFEHGPDKILLVGFRNPELRIHAGKYLSELAEEFNKPAAEVMIDLMVEDDSRIQVVYFSMSEENINKKIQQSWMSFCSDAGSKATEGVFLNQSTHPRAYGSFIRVLGKFSRDEGLFSLEEGIRRLTSFPALNLKLEGRGLLKQGYFADIVIFDPKKVKDNATFEKPHQYAEGMQHVFVNGKQVLSDGEHTGVLSGRFLKGPGWIN
jgi:N-acyl-D-amino-acid deacylase